MEVIKLDLEKKIRELAEAGNGRTRIVRAVPEASEWLVRKIIDEVKATNKVKLFGAPKAAGQSRVNNFEVVSNLQPIEIKSPKVTPVKKDLREMYTVAVFGDVHAPFHHPKNVAVACKIIADQRKKRLDAVVDLGDSHDFYSVSKYPKNPLRRNILQDELKVAAEVRALFTEAAGDAEKHFIPGNHEDRLMSYVGASAPALAGLPQLQLESLLGLKSAGWQMHDKYFVIMNQFVIKHGDLIAGASGATAKKEMDSAWMSGASGHVHRLAIHSRSPLSSYLKGEPPRVWVETGCLCLPDQEYLHGKHADWQPGMVMIRFDEDGNAFPELIPIHEGRAVYQGRVYEAE